MDIYDTSIMDPDPPRPDESSPQRPESSTVRPEDHAPPPPADGEDVSPTLGALKAVGGATLAGLGAVKNVAAGLAATPTTALLPSAGAPTAAEAELVDIITRCLSVERDEYSASKVFWLVGDSHAASIKPGVKRAVQGQMIFRWFAMSPSNALPLAP